MKVIKASIYGLGALLATNAQPSLGQDAASLARANEAFDAALSRRDLATLDSAWLHDGMVTAVHPAGKTVVVGWDGVRKSWQAAFDAFPELSVTLKEPTVRVGGNFGWVVGVETIKGKRPNGDLVEFTAMTTNIYEFRDGKWLMLHHQANRAP